MDKVTVLVNARSRQGRQLLNEGLLRRSLAGEPQAFAQLYQRHLDAIYRYIYLQLGSVVQAEQLTEAVFGRAWTLLPTFQKNETSFEAWLFRLARNLVLGWQRQQRTADPLRGNELPASAVEDELLHVMQGLDELERQIILLRLVEGLSYGDISAVLRREEETCQAIQQQAVTALHAQFARGGGSQ